MSQLGLFDPARVARDEAMERGAQAQERDSPGWYEQAIAFIKEYARTHQEFMCEAARQFAESQGFRKPRDKRAWGSAMLRAAKRGIVRKVGWATASDPKVHMNPASLWKSSIYEGKP